MEYLILMAGYLLPSFWVDIALHPTAFFLGLFGLLAFFWILHRAWRARLPGFCPGCPSRLGGTENLFRP